jgi:hypothetical protein
VVAAASTAAVDVTGILAASLVAGLGLFILPRKRKQSRAEFRRRSEELETRLIEVMNEQFNIELERSVMRIRDAIAPYTRFVRAEQDKLATISEETTTISNEMRSLKHRIGGEDRAVAGVTVRRPIDAPLPTPALAPRIQTPAETSPAEAAPDVSAPPAATSRPAPPAPAAPEKKPAAISPDDV